MVFIRTLAAALALQAALVGVTGAHPGALDGNGCHYETASGQYHCLKTVKPNPNVNARVKKSRENFCHDKSSSNYKTMAECLTSGGRAPG
jgi:hypothetical protein